MQGEMDAAAIRLLLQSHTIGRIGCVHRRQPYIFPVNYIFDGTSIYCQSDEGMKLSILRRHKRICFQADAIVNSGFWQSVLVLGSFEELSGKLADAARHTLYNRLFPKQPAEPEEAIEERMIELIRQGNRLKKVMFRIEIDEVSGRFQHPVNTPVDSKEEA
jgi:nitroimidazol reductase NimA-like FMN-containing flavoprotein (pyridoxamine 5'-phosphate oxidase superfamily)